MKFSIDVLRKYEEEGWLYSQVHPRLPLIIWNYNDNTQYSNYWDEVTLNARALVTDKEGNVVSKGFKKFFNYTEKKTTIPSEIDWVRVYEKLDGSYIGLFYYNGEWIVSSKGSFTSDYVNWAKEILKGKDLTGFNKTWTYCFELITPNNRVVVDYEGRNELVFLRAFYKGQELNIFNIRGFNTVDNWLESNFNPEKFYSLNITNKEGFVIQFSNGERCKIKFEDYIKLHALYTRSSSYDIYNCLKAGNDLSEVIEDAPDEIYDWIDEVANDIKRDFDNLLTDIKSEYKTICLSLGQCTDKEFALFIKDNKYKSYLFGLRNGRDISKNIWKAIKPKYKTFGR